MRTLLVFCAFWAALNAAAEGLLQRPAVEIGPWFEPNRGQAEEDVRFIGRGRGYTLLLESSGNAVFLAAGAAGETKAVRMVLEGATAAPRSRGGSVAPSHTHYYNGPDASRWLVDVPHYTSVFYSGVYPGIDMEWRGRAGRPEYVFHVAPGADPASIVLRFDVTAELSIGERGELVVMSGGMHLRFRKPTAFQSGDGTRRPVAAEYRCAGNMARFEIGAYDRALPLVIDPVLMLSTVFGGSNSDTTAAVAADNAGNVYVAGETYSPDFSAGGMRIPWASGNRRAFVLKMAPDASTVLYMAIFGGSGNDAACAVAAVPGGGIVVAGMTEGTGFPITPGSLRTAYGGQRDAFVARLDAAGHLLFSTYLGDAGEDRATGVAADAAGNIYVGGYTSSLNFPTSSGSARTTYGGGFFDGFIAKLNATGSALLYSTLVGGTGNDQVRALAVSPAGAACIAGYTDSPALPVVSAFQPAYAGGGDALVGCLNPAGSRWTFLSYLGGRLTDEATALAIDPAGNSYLAGDTASDGFPTSPRALQSVRRGPYDAFAVKLNAYGAIQYSTLLGGSGVDAAAAIGVDGAGQAWITGWTGSSDFPQQGEAKTGFRGGTDVFIVQYSADGSALPLSALLGGGGADTPTGLAVVSETDVVLTGTTTSQDFPATLGAPRAVQGVDAFLVRVTASPAPLILSLAPASGTGASVTYRAVYANPAGAAEFEWINLLVNSSLNSAGACYLGYDRRINAFYLSNDTATGALGPLTAGVTGTLQNSQCALDVGASGASVSGAILTLTAALTFKPGFGGARNVYLFASNREGFSSNWRAGGTWTVPGGAVIAANSVTPASGSASSVTFSAVFTNSNGRSDFGWVNILVNSSLNAGGACYIGYYGPTNMFYLSNDTATEAVGPRPPGAAGILQNSQCTLDMGGSSAAGSGATLTLSVAVTFKPAFAGPKNVYLFASSLQGSNTGWQTRGTWVVPSAISITANSLSPSSGAGAAVNLAAVFTDTAGYADFGWINLLVNSSLDAGRSCYIGYYQPTNALYLGNDTGVGALGPLPAGQPGTLQNSQCILDAGSSAINGSGTTLTLTVALTFKPAFAGTKNIYLFSSSAQGPSTGWQARGTWTVPATTVTADFVSPSSGAGATVNLLASFTASKGYTDFEWATVLINSSLNTAGACYVGYYRPANAFYLGNDAATGSLGPLPAGVAGTLQNSQCTLNIGASAATPSGNGLILTLALTFKPALAGVRTVYLSASGIAGTTSGWQARGTWAVP